MKNLYLMIVLGAAYPSATSVGQDVAIPKPRAKAASAAPAKRSAKPAAVSTKSGVAAGTGVLRSTILVMCDLACNWILDGEPKGMIKENGAAKAAVEMGQHSLSASAQDGPDQFTQDFDVKQTGQVIIHVGLASIKSQRLQQEQQAAERSAARAQHAALMKELNVLQAEQSRLQAEREKAFALLQKHRSDLEEITDAINGNGGCRGKKGRVAVSSCQTLDTFQKMVESESLKVQNLDGQLKVVTDQIATYPQ